VPAAMLVPSEEVKKEVRVIHSDAAERNAFCWFADGAVSTTDWRSI